MRWQFWRKDFWRRSTPSFRLDQVFGITTDVRDTSYVDRGGLDDHLRSALSAGKHVAIHGESKQGKSWLRSNILPAAKTLQVQCVPDTTTASALEDALGILGIHATLSTVDKDKIEGSLDFGSGLELGSAYLAKVRSHVDGKIVAGTESATTTKPIGQMPANLAWVSAAIRASDKTLVLEDFHHLQPEQQKLAAFVIKALGEYHINVVVVGIWPRDHLLTYYNGELTDRIEDIHMRWSEADLSAVLAKGCGALRVELDQSMCSELIEAASENVGLLQQLAEQTCKAARVTETQPTSKALNDPSLIATARVATAKATSARFSSFADNFARGIRTEPEDSALQAYLHLLRVVVAATDAELLGGLDQAVIFNRIQTYNARIKRENLTQALKYVDRVQEHHEIRPLVLTFDAIRRKLLLADRRFLLYRRYGEPTWPWSMDAEGD